MFVTQTAPPATTPVLLADFRMHLRLGQGFPEDTAEDPILESYLQAATAQIETRLALAMIARPFTLSTGHWRRDGHLILPVGPVDAIATMRLLGPGGEAVAVEVAELVLEPGTSRQRLTGPRCGTLPPIPAGWRSELDFTAGFGSGPEDVPADLRQATMVLAARLFEDRAAAVTDDTGLPSSVEALIGPWRPVRL